MSFKIDPSVEPYVITDKPGVLSAEGISAAHAQAFLRVAKDKGCVILTRTPGEAALTLLAEGYDAKGFHVKGKSCDWGPWAGFICAEPRFNKSGMAGAKANLGAHLDSLTRDFEQLRNAERSAAGDPIEGPYKSSVVALELSDARVSWLEAQGRIDTATQTGDLKRGKSALPGAAGVTVDWLLCRDASTGRWRAYYDASSLPPIAGADATVLARFEQALADARDKIQIPKVEGLTPVLALTNPYPAYRAPGEAYKHALTGDFDLVAVWPGKNVADFEVRVGGMGQGGLEKTDKETIKREKDSIYRAEGADLIGSTTGNISSGVADIAMAINMETQKIAGQSEVNRVFHSDEGGRPGMTDVDESVAFVDGQIFLLKHPIVEGSPEASDNAKALAPFALSCALQGYTIFLNTGWVAGMREVLAAGDWATLSERVVAQRTQPPAAATSTRKA